jgi:uncharacterized protein
MADYKEVAVVTAVTRYPVKSMAGEELQNARIGWHGIAGDRRFAFLRLHNRSGFPWLTAREVPQLVTYHPGFTNPQDANNSNVVVETPNGARFGVDSTELLQELQAASGEPLHLLRLYGGVFDANDLSIISTQTIASIGGDVDAELDPRRFRSNILIESMDARSFAEDRWVGQLMVFGERPDSARVRLYRKDLRCVVVNVNPTNGVEDCDVLRPIVRQRKNLAGLYAGSERPGTVEVGDVVRILK